MGTALSVFNTATKLFNVPLLAVTTSLVATAEGGGGQHRASTCISIASGDLVTHVSIDRLMSMCPQQREERRLDDYNIDCSEAIT